MDTTLHVSGFGEDSSLNREAEQPIQNEGKLEAQMVQRLKRFEVGSAVFLSGAYVLSRMYRGGVGVWRAVAEISILWLGMWLIHSVRALLRDIADLQRFRAVLMAPNREFVEMMRRFSPSPLQSVTTIAFRDFGGMQRVLEDVVSRRFDVSAADKSVATFTECSTPIVRIERWRNHSVISAATGTMRTIQVDSNELPQIDLWETRLTGDWSDLLSDAHSRTGGPPRFVLELNDNWLRLRPKGGILALRDASELLPEDLLFEIPLQGWRLHREFGSEPFQLPGLGYSTVADDEHWRIYAHHRDDVRGIEWWATVADLQWRQDYQEPVFGSDASPW